MARGGGRTSSPCRTARRACEGARSYPMDDGASFLMSHVDRADRTVMSRFTGGRPRFCGRSMRVRGIAIGRQRAAVADARPKRATHRRSPRAVAFFLLSLVAGGRDVCALIIMKRISCENFTRRLPLEVARRRRAWAVSRQNSDNRAMLDLLSAVFGSVYSHRTAARRRGQSSRH